MKVWKIKKPLIHLYCFSTILAKVINYCNLVIHGCGIIFGAIKNEVLKKWKLKTKMIQVLT